MTDSLQHAFNVASQLPPDEQNALAARLIHEFQSEEKWAALFAKSQDKLASLAQEALAEHRRGETEDLELN